MTPVDYGIDADPRGAVLGQPINLQLSCRAVAYAENAFTFGHRSLVIEIMREGLTEPRLVFPNRHTVTQGDKLIRKAAMGGIEELQPGEERTRSFELIALFDSFVLTPGVLALTYRLEEAEPMVRPEPIEVVIGCGPTAVPILIGHLSSESAAVRFRAGELLSAMTASDHGYDPDAEPVARGGAIQRWSTWWHDIGSRLPWSFGSSGATFGQTLGPAPPSGLSLNVGGIAYPERAQGGS